MKNLKSTITLGLALLITLSLRAQNKETRSLSSFSSVSVGESIELILVPGSKEEAIVQVEGKDPDIVITEISGQRLRIRMARGTWKNVNAKVRLTYKSIDDLSVSSSADAYSEGVIKSGDFDLEVSSSGFAKLELDVTSLDVEISSSGKAELSGRTGSQDAEISSSGKLYAFDLQCDDLDIEVSSSGRAEVYVNKSIDAEANSSGKVAYKGNPKMVDIETNSSGKVSKSN